MPANIQFPAGTLEALCHWLHRETGLFYGQAKRPFVALRLAAWAQAAGLTTPEEVERAFSNPAHRDSLIASFTINETRFFRMPEQFRAIAHLAPTLAERRRRRSPDQPKLRLWSAACSTGEEPYSLSMALLACRAQAEILATDLDSQALAQARTGIYRAERLELVPPGLRQAYMTEQGEQIAVRPEVKAPIRFERHNLKDPCPPGVWDVICCRNVLIYFDAALRTQLIQRFYEALAPGGWLFVGEGETLHLVPHRFESHDVEGALCYRRPEETL